MTRVLRGFFGAWLAFFLAAGTQLCLARDGFPTKYEFTKPPLEILADLAALNLGNAPAYSDAERQFLSTVWNSRAAKAGAQMSFSEAVVLEAMLRASGVDDAVALQKYKGQYEKLVAAAVGSTKDARDHRDRGERLMRFLHAGVMSKGYEGNQTLWPAVFDTGKFNCVSSTAMYYLVGSRLGMTLKPISIPSSGWVAGHASLDLVDGEQRVQLEPTNPDGFDWSTKIKRPGVIVIGFVPDRKDGHEVDALGLASTIYSNRGVDLDKAEPPKPLEAMRLYLAALALDPLSPTATNNLRANITNWGPKLAGEKRFEDAVQLLAYGRAIAPESDEIKTNLRSVWIRYIDATLASSKEQDSLELMRRAAEMVPQDQDFGQPSVWFIRRAETSVDEKGFEAGLAVAMQSLAFLSTAEAKKISEWRSGLFRRWSQEHLEQQRLDDSVKVLAKGYAIDANDEKIHDGLGYHTQKALEILDVKDGAMMKEHFASLRKQFPQVKDIAEAGWSHAGRSVQKLAKEGKYEAAIQAVARYQPLVADAEQQEELGSMPYQMWAKKLTDDKQWEAALARYKEGLKVYPKSKSLEDGIAYTIHRWAKASMDEKKWDEAIRIYDLGLKDYLPGNSLFQNNKEYCEAKKRGK